MDCWSDPLELLLILCSYHFSFSLRYGVEPPVLVKLEKEIELEETLLMSSDPVASVITTKSCCQHGELHEAVSIMHMLSSEDCERWFHLYQLEILGH